jgi:hypothetical protein
MLVLRRARARSRGTACGRPWLVVGLDLFWPLRALLCSVALALARVALVVFAFALCLLAFALCLRALALSRGRCMLTSVLAVDSPAAFVLEVAVGTER